MAKKFFFYFNIDGLIRMLKIVIFNKNKMIRILIIKQWKANLPEQMQTKRLSNKFRRREKIIIIAVKCKMQNKKLSLKSYLLILFLRG